LVLHQRDQRGDDQGQPLQHHRRQLVAEALAGAGGHHHDDVAPGEHGVHHLGLPGPEGGESKRLLELRACVVVEPERLRHAPHLPVSPPAATASPAPAGSAWRPPARASETYRPAPTITWSRTRRWKILAPACSSRVRARSESEGSGSPEGWLWAKMTAVARAPSAARNTSRGSTVHASVVPSATRASPRSTFRVLKDRTWNTSCRRSASRGAR